MKLPVLQIVTLAYSAVTGNIGRFFLSAIPALAVILALWLIRLGSDIQAVWLFIVWPIIDILPYIFFGLIWIRLYLLESSETLLPRSLFGSRSLVYFAVATVIYLLFWLPIIFFAFPVLVEFLEASRTGALPAPMTLIQGLVLLPGMLLAWCYLLGRISLLLPAMAVDGSMEPRAAWRATAGNGLRLLAAYLLAGTPVLVLVTLLAIFALGQGHWAGSGSWYPTRESYGIERALTGLSLALLRLISVALLAIVAAEAYRRLISRQSRHQI